MISRISGYSPVFKGKYTFGDTNAQKNILKRLSDKYGENDGKQIFDALESFRKECEALTSDEKDKESLIVVETDVSYGDTAHKTVVDLQLKCIPFDENKKVDFDNPDFEFESPMRDSNKEGYTGQKMAQYISQVAPAAFKIRGIKVPDEHKKISQLPLPFTTQKRRPNRPGEAKASDVLNLLG